MDKTFAGVNECARTSAAHEPGVGTCWTEAASQRIL